MPSLSAALDEFYRARDLAERMQQKSAALHRVLKNNLERSEKKLAIQEEALLNCERAEDYRIKGELLMANLHLVSKGAKRVSVPNYYDEALTPMEIELDERISPAQNAQRYFKRYQKARSARKFALEQKAIAQEEIRYPRFRSCSRWKPAPKKPNWPKSAKSWKSWAMCAQITTAGR